MITKHIHPHLLRAGSSALLARSPPFRSINKFFFSFSSLILGVFNTRIFTLLWFILILYDKDDTKYFIQWWWTWLKGSYLCMCICVCTCIWYVRDPTGEWTQGLHINLQLRAFFIFYLRQGLTKLPGGTHSAPTSDPPVSASQGVGITGTCHRTGILLTRFAFSIIV